MNTTQFENIVDLAAKDSKRGARVVAKAFYRILRKKGFSKNQIIDISTNILNCLVESLSGYEEKIEHVTDNRQVTHKAIVSKDKTSAGTITKFVNKYHYSEREPYTA
jgi:hypothetical protein